MCISLTPRTFSVLFLLLFLPGCSITHALRVENRTTVDVSTMIAEVSSVPVVFVGERHTSAADHAVQLEVLQGLQAIGKSLAIGMEMFEASSQKALDAWSSGTLTTRDFARVYAWNWRNIPYGNYGDIFNFARDNRIPIIALNAPREIVTKVSRQGLSALSDSDKLLLPPGVDGEVSDDYLNFIRTSYGVHGQNEAQFRFICEAQALRNRVMASRIVSFHLLHPGSVMVVIAGGGHARDKGGIPAELGTVPFRVILPPIPGVNEESIRSEDAHFLLEEPFSILEYL
ncbi:MAG: ChaN family lipoprotein [Desulfuromonadaceae bacterium]|nr:ChaN family lipoprotein [Desulfuromonadaceae bacterium]